MLKNRTGRIMVMERPSQRGTNREIQSGTVNRRGYSDAPPTIGLCRLGERLVVHAIGLLFLVRRGPAVSAALSASCVKAIARQLRMHAWRKPGHDGRRSRSDIAHAGNRGDGGADSDSRRAGKPASASVQSPASNADAVRSLELAFCVRA